MVFFADANPDAVVEVLPNCVVAGEARPYAPIISADYLRERLTATYDHLRTGA